LAAGGSTRLGRPKQLLTIEGHDRPLVSHVLAQLEAAKLARYAVVVGSQAELIGRALATQRCDRLDNSDWAEGIASSIRVAVAWACAHSLDALMLAVCDQPRLTSEHVRALCSAHQLRGATVASGYAGTRGIPAVFAASWYPRLQALSGDRGAGALLRDDPEVIVIDWPDGAFDIDTPEDARASGYS
jgi:CTP:molybdopterin cytidylyltransferase MocA